MDTHPPISFMAWRIGDTLDIDQQIEWIRDHGFQAVSLHASAGAAGAWRGVDPAEADGPTRAALREKLSTFKAREVHAPFSAVMTVGETDKALSQLEPVLAFAGAIDADIVTVHANVPSADSAEEHAAWSEALAVLNTLAAQNGLRVGLEITSGFEVVMDLALSHIGVTLDVGHMYLGETPPITAFGELGDVVRLLGGILVHLHLHQVRDGVDHVELGRGDVDYGSLLSALREIDYVGMLCLELNPGRVDPDGMVRSRVWLERQWQNAEC
ncbi:MAG: sugar phosphate isomerase/epimerase [Lentisphaeria bacterium]|nr:sugar phosphate isomerase/epimerase [Lentisphaeria bacterium]